MYYVCFYTNLQVSEESLGKGVKVEERSRLLSTAVTSGLHASLFWDFPTLKVLKNAGLVTSHHGL